ncbi:hypothetical protein [Actinophytocola sediminis]
MHSPLPGRAGIIDLFENCVIWPRPRGRQLPITLLLGPAGSGKTALLHEFDQLAAAIPHAYTDLATSNPATPIDIMVDLVTQLSIGHRRLGRLRFPRFWVGLLVTKMDHDGQSPEEQRVAVRNMLTSIRRFRRIPTEVRDLVTRLVVALTNPAPPANVAVAVDTAAQTLQLLHGPAERWWASRGNQSAVDALLRLKVTFDRGGQLDLRTVEERLCSAFLADLRAAYTNKLRGPDRTVATVALLDNAHGAVGKAFLELLARVRSTPESRPDPLLVVAASRHTLNPELFTGEVATPEEASRTAWEQRFNHADWRSRCYPVGLRDLSRDEVERLAQRYGLRSRGSLASFVHRLTAGHPGGVRAVLGLLAGSPAAAPRQMLAQAPELLDALLVDVPAELREHLVTCAAARQLTLATLRAALGSVTDDDHRQAAQDLSTTIRELHWLNPATGEPHPWLRRLLLLRLAQRPAEHPSSWDRVHRRLAAHHQEAGDLTGELGHRLAVGEVERVVRELNQALTPDRPAPDWLAAFTAVTAAPTAIDGDRTTLRELASWADEQDRRTRDLAWLVPAHWLEADPLNDPFAALLPRIAARWQELSGEVPAHADALFDRGQEVNATARRHGDLVESLASWRSGGQPGHQPRRQPVRPRVSPRRQVLRVGAAALPVVLAAAVLLPSAFAQETCAAGIESRDGECVGITDGGFEFHPRLAPVLKRIHERNVEVGTGDGVVTVVAAVPVPHEGAGLLSIDAVAHTLQGAYVAQYQANVRSSATPKIRLLVANVGDQADHWAPVLDQLADLEDLRVVVELNPSRKNGLAAMRTLGERGIPTMAAIITSDDIHGDATAGGIRRFARVAPTNRDQVEVGISTQHLTSDRTLLIRDSNQDDLYNTTLAEHFLRLLPGAATETFESTPDGAADVAVRMRNIVNEICAGDYRSVYFAGRSAALRQFVIELGDRHCNPNLPVTVVTADDATVIEIDEDNPEHERFATALRERGVTVLCTALAHPDQWRDADRGEASAFVWFAEHYRQTFPDSPLDDGQAMMSHDALTTTVKAVQGGGAANIWLNMHGENKVDGVTGPIELDQHGNTIGKRIPILRLEPDGAKSFVQLGAADR